MANRLAHSTAGKPIVGSSWFSLQAYSSASFFAFSVVRD
jgi:hypothetical protein